MDDNLSRDIRTVHAFYESLLALQYQPPEAVQAHQGELLRRLLAHARETVPYYRRTLAPHFDDRGEWRRDRWGSLPFLTKAILREEGDALLSSDLPANHGSARVVTTGGSTGTPVRLRVTELENLARLTATYRMFDWFGLDCGMPMAMLRKKQVFSSNADAVPARKWGYPWFPEEKLGDRLFLDVATPAGEQLAWLALQAPLYVNTLPSNILSLAFEADRTGVVPSIGIIVSVAEKLTADIRAAAHEVFGCRVIDILSSAEAGLMAIECPQSGMLHIQSELVCLEVLKPNGEPCTPGEVGEIVVTSLYNYALPIIRYRSGDYVELGGRCPCGRQLPTIARVLGRAEHLFDLPDGSMEMPDINRFAIARRLGHLDWRLVQTQPNAGEFRHAAESLGESEQAAVRTALGPHLPAGFAIAFRGGFKVAPIGSGKRYFVTNEMEK